MEKSTKQLLNMLLGFGLSISTALTLISGADISQKLDELKEKDDSIKLQQYELLDEVRADESYLDYVRGATSLVRAARENGTLNEEQYQTTVKGFASDKYIIDLMNKGEQSVINEELVKRQLTINQMQAECDEQRQIYDEKSLDFGMAVAVQMGLVGFNLANLFDHLEKKRVKKEAMTEMNSEDETIVGKQGRVLSIGKVCGSADGALLRYDNKFYLRDKYSVIETDEKSM